MDSRQVELPFVSHTDRYGHFCGLQNELVGHNQKLLRLKNSGQIYLGCTCFHFSLGLFLNRTEIPFWIQLIQGIGRITEAWNMINLKISLLLVPFWHWGRVLVSYTFLSLNSVKSFRENSIGLSLQQCEFVFCSSGAYWKVSTALKSDTRDQEFIQKPIEFSLNEF